jgi:starvation-inducible DNA-binding protein
MSLLMQRSSLDLSESLRLSVIPLLQASLVTAIDLYAQTKQAHWTVKGPHFISLHQLFDTLAAELLEPIDTLAERIVAMGGTPDGTVCQVASQSALQAYPVNLAEGNAVVKALEDRYLVLAAQVREHADKASDLGDLSSADVFTEISRLVDKQVWFLGAHLSA